MRKEVRGRKLCIRQGCSTTRCPLGNAFTFLKLPWLIFYCFQCLSTVFRRSVFEAEIANVHFNVEICHLMKVLVTRSCSVTHHRVFVVMAPRVPVHRFKGYSLKWSILVQERERTSQFILHLNGKSWFKHFFRIEILCKSLGQKVDQYKTCTASRESCNKVRSEEPVREADTKHLKSHNFSSFSCWLKSDDPRYPGNKSTYIS